MSSEINCDPIYPHAKSATSFQDGMQYQDFVCRALAKQHIILQNIVSKKFQYEIGENLQGFEIKLDERCTDTNRLSIEVAEKTNRNNDQWVPSGIWRSDNSWLYIQGNYQIIFIFAKNFLIEWYEKYQPELHESYGTVQKFYMPFSTARRWAAKVLEGEAL